MYLKKILVDSSVWIDFFNGKETELLERLLTEDMVSTNELILTELIPVLERKKQKEIIEGMLSLPLVPMSIDWYLIRKMQNENLNHGVNKVGIPDLIILQQVIDQKIQLLSYDKHFKLMQNHFKFDLMNS